MVASFLPLVRTFSVLTPGQLPALKEAKAGALSLGN